MSTAKVRVFAGTEDPQKIVPTEVSLDEGMAFYVKIEHPQGGSRIVTVLLGPKGGIDITRGMKIS